MKPRARLQGALIYINSNRQFENRKKIHASGIKTFVFIGPLLPGNPEKLIEHLAEKADTIFIDKMNYLVKGFYHRFGLDRGTTDQFFKESKDKLVSELLKRKMNFQALF